MLRAEEVKVEPKGVGELEKRSFGTQFQAARFQSPRPNGVIRAPTPASPPLWFPVISGWQ
ncbi:hypothetical protein PHLCEN_2v12063 [Hermanssonia centrifuga]|uniref:Uncharacterized protein n=1 Tax=Hermanssonia centrifuga TaxID=98765 RepID=A0A2R6NJ99_9APHY|nr:hypothetical protein PHLCEN_2v12063 [Hermanssonia centrifuga]